MAKDKTKSWDADGQTQQQNLEQPKLPEEIREIRRTTPFKCLAPETPEQQEKDAQMIFKQVTSAPIEAYDHAEMMVTMIYVPDPTVSRSGISRALELLKRHYSQPRSEA